MIDSSEFHATVKQFQASEEQELLAAISILADRYMRCMNKKGIGSFAVISELQHLVHRQVSITIGEIIRDKESAVAE